jgi:hypothetical protein
VSQHTRGDDRHVDRQFTLPLGVQVELDADAGTVMPRAPWPEAADSAARDAILDAIATRD